MDLGTGRRLFGAGRFFHREGNGQWAEDIPLGKEREGFGMKEFVNVVQCGFAAVGGFFGWVMGGLDGFLYALVVFVALDYLTGLMAAAVERKLSSEVGFKGIFKKVVIFCLVAVGHIIDSSVIQNGSVLRTAVVFFYLSNEGISILENASRIGLPVPERLKAVLEQLREEKEEEEEE